MEPDPVDALATALAQQGPWSTFVRQTETGEKYVDLGRTAADQPVETVWFNPGSVTWGDEYEFTVSLSGDVTDTARAILYTLRDAD